MNEVPKNFRPVETVLVSEKIPVDVIYEITKLKTIANNHEDFEVLEKFMDAVADFKTELLQIYTEAEINQVPLYHHLIGSGVAKDTVFENPINEETRLAIEKAIVGFVTDVLAPIVIG